MPIDKQNLRDLLTALGIIGAAMLFYSLLFARPAHAFVVSDPPVEANTGKIAVSAAETTAGIQQANQTPSQDLEQNTLTAKAVVTGGGAGAFQGQAQYLDSLTQM